MKKVVVAVLVASVLALGSGMAGAAGPVTTESVTDGYEDAFTHPLRLAYYLVHPAGFAVEWLVGRPLHYLVSRPYLRDMFGYRPIAEEGNDRLFGERL